MNDFYVNIKLINDNGGVDNFRCFAIMDRMEIVTPFGFGISSSNVATWTECRISEKRYKLEDEYKITLVPLDSSFASHDFYFSDFMSMVKSGDIIIKTSENQHVTHIRGLEHLCGAAYLRHDCDCVEL